MQNSMQAERLKILSELVETEPEEPFNRYALAMEYIGKDTAEALKHLEVLLIDFPEYLATYYQAAAIYAEQDEEEKAAAVFEKGIILAAKQRNDKILKELKGAFKMYKDEWEM
ncbi:MAG: tetratricopeptide repeat protein [Spirosomaceae bacterium]|nr:tetratricopeptide repeat protein [Spirosomataceae bacterium]